MLKAFWKWVFKFHPLWAKVSKDAQHYTTLLVSTEAQLKAGVKIYCAWPDDLSRTEEVLIVMRRSDGTQELVWVEHKFGSMTREEAIRRALLNASVNEAIRSRTTISKTLSPWDDHNQVHHI